MACQSGWGRQDVLVTKFRLQVAGRTLGEGLKLQGGGLSGSLKNLNPGRAVEWEPRFQTSQPAVAALLVLGMGGERPCLHGCPACEPSAGLSGEQESSMQVTPLETLGCPWFAPKACRPQQK